MNPTLKKWLPFVLSVLTTLAIAAVFLWWLSPDENTLPTVYGVM